MTEDDSQLSRRNVLAGLGTIGVGGALVGAGTSAFFSDDKQFDDNQLVGGELAIVVDWRKKYDMGKGLRLIDVFPDSDGDGEQDDLDVDDFCDRYADIDEPLTDEKRSIIDYHTREITRGDETEETRPIIDLDDVKPGDCGKLQLSYHLCDNDGWVWFRTKNKVYDGELADEIDAVLWYDLDGDGHRGEDEPIIASGSLRDVLDELNDGTLLDAEPGETVEGACVELGKVDTGEIDEGDTFTFEDGDGEEVTIDIKEVEREEGEAVGFHWSSDRGICQVDVKGGPDTNTTTYDCQQKGWAYAPENLVNPNRERYEISNFTFYVCADDADVPVCYPASETNYIALEWCLPTDVGNEVQRDSVEFGFQFYTEQCRHNDAPENPWTNE